MSAIREWLIDILRQSSIVLLADIAVKATVLVLLAMLVLRLLPRSSAAVRHWVWCLTFCGLIVLPALCYVLPAWAVPILPSWYDDSPQIVAADDSASNANDAPTPAAEIDEPPVRPSAEDHSDLVPDGLDVQAASATAMKKERLADKTAAPMAEVVSTTTASKVQAAKPPPESQPFNPLAAWLVGAALCLLPLVAGLLRSAILRARARRVQDAAWLSLRDQTSARLGLRRAVQLLEIRAPIIPMSCGVVRPAVILPADAGRWNEPLRRFVLLHELAHVKRHDVVFQLLARLACVLYWFHPLVWYAMHRLRIERELACDDAVLAAGERASDYAEQLLEVARRLQPLRLHAAVAMAQSNKLEYRVGTLFSRARSHLPLSTRASRLLLACAAAIVVAVSVVRPSARATDDEKPASERQTAAIENPPVQGEKAKPTQITGRVVSHDGKPVSGARVVVVRVQSEPNRGASRTELVSEAATDSQGRFKTPYPAEPPRSGFYLLASAPAHGLTWDHGQAARGGKECVLKLAPDDAPIEGRILDLEGQPIAGVQVAVRSVTESVDDVDEWIEKARKNPSDPGRINATSYYAMSGPRADKMANFPAQDSLNLDDPRLSRVTVTGRDGRFRLTGLGSKRLVRLEVSGAGIAKGWINAVTYPMEAVPYPQFDPRYRFTKCFGSRFDASVEPEQRITGVVRDSATRRPLAGVEVKLRSFANFGMGDEPFVSDVTDADGRYELTGVPRPGDARSGLKLRVIPAGDQPYFRIDVDAPRAAGLDAIVCDVELKRSIWIRGRVVDERTGKPVLGEVAYYPFLTNEAAKDYANFDPGVLGISDDYHYATAEDGSFRIPGLPGRGVLAFIANEDVRYPRADGAEAIGGLRRRSTAEPQVLYYFMTAEVLNAVREINPPAGAEEFSYEIRLNSFKPHKLRLLDRNGEPLGGVTAEGLTQIPLRGLRGKNVAQSSAIVEVLGLAEDQPRPVMLVHADRGLAAAIAGLTVDDFLNDTPKDIKLLPAASIVGRLLDENGKPVSEASAFASLDTGDEGESKSMRGGWRPSRGDRTNADGRFRIDLVPSGVKYSFQAYHLAIDRGATMEIGPLKPKEQLGLGDITLLPPKPEADAPSPQPRPISFADRFPSKAMSKEKQEATHNTQTSNSADNIEKDAKTTIPSQITGPKEQTTVRGQIIGPGGRPASGAHVAVIARRAVVERGAELEPDRVVLGEATAGENGQYQLMITGASSKTHRNAYLLARGKSSAMAWQKLNLDAAETEASFELKPGEVLHGRVVDIEGQPATAVELKVSAIRPAIVKNQLLPGGIDFWRSAGLPAAWPQPVLSDQEGRFSIAGIPVDHGVRLSVEGSDRFAVQDIALNTGEAKPRGERDRTYRPQTADNVKPSEEFVLPLAPAQIFTGRVTYEDTGEQAPFAPLQIWASQKEYGSMIAIGGRADAEGRYRLNPYPGIRFGVTAYAPQNEPYLTRELKNIAWDAGKRAKEVNVTLPRGVMVRGQVLEEGSGQPVAGASIQYVPERANNPNVRDDIRTGWQGNEVSDEQGRFAMVVLPGPGRLLVHGQEDKYVLRETSSSELYFGRPGGQRNYVHGMVRLDPAKESEPLDVTIRLQPGGTAMGQLVDEQGRSVDEALMVTRLHVRPYWLRWQGSPREILGGRFELGGLAEGEQYPVHFLDPKRRLGATVMLKAGTEPVRVVLKSCGEASMRFVDADGKPIANHSPGTRMVVTPGPLDWNRDVSDADLSADEDFVANIDRLNHGTLKGDAEGRVTLPALIPGATYRVLTVRDEKLIVAKEFQAKAGQTIELGDIVYERGER
ncbi:MAG: M56 family metallopeptidase [Pirellulales bacterium]